MGDVLAIGISAMVINNILLSQFLGICPFLGVSKKSESAIGMSLSVLFVMLTSSVITYILYHYVLFTFDITYLRTIVFILVISSLVQFIEMLIKKIAPAMYSLLGIYIPLITTNCAILGVALKNIDNGFNFVEMISYSTFSALGFGLVMYIFSVIRERIEHAPIPEPFKGVPIALITAAIMALIFSRFAGVI